MESYAKFDALARELDAEPSHQLDGTWTKRRPEDFYLQPATRDAEARTLAACAPLGSTVELDGLVKQPVYNGKQGVVVSGRLCQGERLAVELTAPRYEKRVLLVKTSQVTTCFLKPAAPLLDLLKNRVALVKDHVWLGDACAAEGVAQGTVPAALKWPAFTKVVLCAKEFDGCDDSHVAPCGADLARAMSAAAGSGGPVLVCAVLRNDPRPVQVAAGALYLGGHTLPDAWAAVSKARPKCKLAPTRWRALAAAITEASRDIAETAVKRKLTAPELEAGASAVRAAAAALCPAAFPPAPPPAPAAEPGPPPPPASGTKAPDVDAERRLELEALRIHNNT